jgi:hypothetical protein
MESGVIVRPKEVPWTRYFKGWATFSNTSKRAVT